MNEFTAAYTAYAIAPPALRPALHVLEPTPHPCGLKQAVAVGGRRESNFLRVDRINAAFQAIPHIARRTSWRGAQLVTTRVACIARVTEPRREEGPTLLATPATACVAGEALRSRCCIVAHAAVQPAAATRARVRQQVHTGCHTCVHVLTRAHGWVPRSTRFRTSQSERAAEAGSYL
jgi:hypothetical protein